MAMYMTIFWFAVLFHIAINTFQLPLYLLERNSNTHTRHNLVREESIESTKRRLSSFLPLSLFVYKIAREALPGLDQF